MSIVFTLDAQGHTAMKFRELRQESGVLVKELADSAKVYRTTITNMENGKGISLVYAARIVRALSQLTGKELSLSDFTDIVLIPDRAIRRRSKENTE